VCVTIDVVWIGELDLLITCTHSSEPQVITDPLLISTLPACCLFTSRSLVMASNSGDSSAFRSHIVTFRRISPAELSSTVNSTFATSLLSFSCRARLTCQTFIFQLNTCGYSPYVIYSLTRRRIWHIQLLLVLASAVILISESRGTHNHILLFQIRDSPNLEGQVPVFISPQEQGDPIIPPGTVASYDSQGYGGGIRTRLHTGLEKLCSFMGRAYRCWGPRRTNRNNDYTV
jgi:hypothetical protein